MHRFRALCCTFLCATGLLAPAAGAAADALQTARLAYDQGRFLEAAESALALDTPEGLTLANLSLVTYAYHFADDDQQREYYERAMSLGEEAVARDPDDAENFLRWAHAMGRYAKLIGVMKAARQGFAGRIRNALETAIELEPGSAMAHVGLAAWHAEAIKEGGFLARFIGASKRTAEAHYEIAFELGPESKLLLYEYARGLVMLNKGRNLQRARSVYRQALELPSPTVPDRLLDRLIEKKLAKLQRPAPDR